MRDQVKSVAQEIAEGEIRYRIGQNATAEDTKDAEELKGKFTFTPSASLASSAVAFSHTTETLRPSAGVFLGQASRQPGTQDIC